MDKDIGQTRFILEMSERQISAREFFSNILLDSLERNFDLKDVLILFFDTQNNFLSWLDRNGLRINCEDHPYCKFASSDPIGRLIYQEAVRDHLTYFNTIPRLYKSTDVIPPAEYESSPYVRFIEENFNAHYSVTFALGINSYIQILFFKSREEGDFSEAEIEKLKKVYVYLANSYKNFKKHEQQKIISNIQDEIICSGENAYLVTDDFMHIMAYNKTAVDYLKSILGPTVEENLSSTKPCTWLPFLLGTMPVLHLDDDDHHITDTVQTRVIKNLIFKIYTYDQSYSHGIVDRYHWITISPNEPHSSPAPSQTNLPLTQAEYRVAELLYSGLTYQAIADELVISYHTVKNHVQNIYTKCGVKSRFQLYKLWKNIDR